MVGEGTSLTIADVKETDATIYTCIATNSVGNATSSARLIPFGKRDNFEIPSLLL